MNKSQYTPTAAEIKARTHEATVRNVFAAKERHDRSFAAMVTKSQAENVEFNWDTGLLLA
jgi:hypothetical protein